MASQLIKLDPAVDTLIDDCVDLRIKISVLMDSEDIDHARLTKLLGELGQIERRIERQRQRRIR